MTPMIDSLPYQLLLDEPDLLRTWYLHLSATETAAADAVVVAYGMTFSFP
jgi:hypothetical protein